MKRFLSYIMAALLVVTLPSCATLKGALIGTGSGAALGAAVGAAIGDGKGAAIGAAVGAAVGSSVGSIIGAVMDKKAKELEEVAGAEVETVTDVNGLEAIKVTFDSGILFGFNSSKLYSVSKKSWNKKNFRISAGWVCTVLHTRKMWTIQEKVRRSSFLRA